MSWAALIYNSGTGFVGRRLVGPFATEAAADRWALPHADGWTVVSCDPRSPFLSAPDVVSRALGTTPHDPWAGAAPGDGAPRWWDRALAADLLTWADAVARTVLYRAHPAEPWRSLTLGRALGVCPLTGELREAP